ncbi:MAG: M23 family metallopeptidase [Caulobacteraceae bacterium]|nr:M23 family metallopeptidase [Caulobacteraceae bacterium]
MPDDIKSGLNLGGPGNTSGGSKASRLVADLTENYRKLDQIIEKIEGRTKSISTNLRNAFPGGTSGGGSSAGSSMSFVDGGTVPVGGRSSSGFLQGSNGSKFDWKGALSTMGSAALTGAAKLLVPADYITNDIAINRFGFFNAGNTSDATKKIATDTMGNMMHYGTAISNLDAANAVMAGSSMGFMPGLSNYGTVKGSVANVSNVVPGAGLEASMGAVAALNQGASVNKLRMLGIQVRDPQGYMRSVEDIAKDLWKTISRTKTGGSAAITQADLSYSLQPGMSLDMLLNQYFAGDPVLRQSIIAYLFQFAAQGGATDVNNGKLLASGARPGITESVANREYQSYNFMNRYTGAGVAGIMGGNTVISSISGTLANLGPILGGVASGAVTASTFLETIAGAGNGGGGDVLGGLGSLLKSGAGGDLGGIFTGLGSAAIDLAVPLAAAFLVAGVVDAIAQHKLSPDEIKNFMKVGYGSDYNNLNSPNWKKPSVVSDKPLGGGFGMGVPLGGLFSKATAETGLVIDDAFRDSAIHRITSDYNVRRTYTDLKGIKHTDIHDGVDYGAKEGLSLFPVAGGKVAANKYEPNGKGNYLVVRHPNGYSTIYGHMKSRSALAEGTSVGLSTKIGEVGKTGSATGAHLHLGVQDDNGKLYNPHDFLNNNLPSRGSVGGGYGQGAPLETTTTNYGGVVVNINLPQNASINETVLAKEIKRIITQDTRIREAVSR